MFPIALNKEEKDDERLFFFHLQEHNRVKLLLFVKIKLISISKNARFKQLKQLTTPQTVRRKNPPSTETRESGYRMLFLAKGRMFF